MFLASNWYFFMAASTGKETKPRNPRKRKVNRDFFIHTQREREREREASKILACYRKLWATNEVHAKSKFWYFLRKLKKVKKSNGQMLAINEIFEKNPTKKSEQR